MSTAEALQDIYTRHGDLTPAIVVDEARDESHPLHTHFEWDDSVAAEAYRINQAAGLIRRVKVTIMSPTGGEPRQVRAWVARQELIRPLTESDADEVPVGSYMPVEDVAKEPAYRSAWQAQLERDWKRLRKKAGDAKWFLDMVAADLADEAV